MRNLKIRERSSEYSRPQHRGESGETVSEFPRLEEGKQVRPISMEAELSAEEGKTSPSVARRPLREGSHE